MKPIIDTSTYEEKLNECIRKVIRIRADNTDQLKTVMEQWKEQAAKYETNHRHLKTQRAY